jgi:proton-dependent oligopeptide transporter, POT family
MNNLKGLFVFSITNMLERFGFYLMMSVIISSFMEDGGYGMQTAGVYYSFFYTAIYISMIIMGLIGDFVNRRKIIIFGMALMAIGYLSYFIMSKGNELSLIIPGTILILGLGAFKTNLMVQVFDLHKNNLRNGAIGYMIFYAFINIGAFFAPIASVFIKQNFGINSVFLVSAVFTLLAFAIYYFFPVSTEIEHESQINQREIIANDIVDSPKVSPIQSKTSSISYGVDKIIGLLFLVFLVPIFWIAFHQTGLTYVFYIRDLFPLDSYPLKKLSIANPVANIFFSIFGVLLLYIFVKIRKTYSIFPFISIGMLIVAIGYFVPAYDAANISGKISYMSALIPILIIALGELIIVPFITLGFYHFSPAKVRGLFLGLFMALTAFGNNFLFIYAIAYDKFGAESAFKSIVIHVLVCAASVFIIWILIKKLSNRQENPMQ